MIRRTERGSVSLGVLVALLLVAAAAVVHLAEVSAAGRLSSRAPRPGASVWLALRVAAALPMWSDPDACAPGAPALLVELDGGSSTVGCQLLDVDRVRLTAVGPGGTAVREHLVHPPPGG